MIISRPCLAALKATLFKPQKIAQTKAMKAKKAMKAMKR